MKIRKEIVMSEMTLIQRPELEEEVKKNKNTNITLTIVQLAKIYIKKEYNPHTNTIMQAYLKT